jgi:histone-lysine N-methyltransferase SETMAR
MPLSREVIRNLLLYEFELNHSAEMGWELLDHPPYSPDLSPSDFHLFRSLEHFLNKKKFRDIEHLRRELTNFFESKDNEFYERGIDLLPERWQKTLDSNGEYFN